MQPDLTYPAQMHRDYGEAAGVGSMIWGTRSQLVVRYYNYVIAAFTVGILLLLFFAGYFSWQLAASVITLYLLYFLVRQTLLTRPPLERQFYRQDVQFLRAQVGWLAITVLFILGQNGVEDSALWLLFVPVIMLVSKHCNTERMIMICCESAIALIVAQLYHGVPFSMVLINFDLWAELLGLAMLAFIIHYLVRNVQARDRTISGYTTVGNLIHSVDMLDPAGAKEWQPMLATLLNFLKADCVSVWMAESKMLQIHRVASVRDNGRDGEWLESSATAPDRVVSLDSPASLATSIRSGEFQYCDDPAQLSTMALCRDVSAELIVPINLGTGHHRTTVGALGVGFRGSSFHKHLLSNYRDFVERLIDQAKPMLVSARRLDETLALQQVARQVSQSLDLDEVLDNILQAVVDKLGFEFATISLVDEEKQLIRARRGINVPQAWLDMSIHPLDSTDIQADIVRSGEGVVITGWDDRFDRRIWERFGHSDMIRVFTPIKVADTLTNRTRVLGTIETGYRLSTRVEIGSDQLRMLDAFKYQAALAIEHAQLLQRARRKADILTTLHSVSQTIASAREPEQVMDAIGRSAAMLLDADIVMVYPYRRGKNAVDPPAVFGSIWGKSRFNLDLSEDNLLTQRLRVTQPYYSADAHQDRDLMFHTSTNGDKSGKLKPTFLKRQNIKSFASLPLIAHGETIGIMFVNYRSRHQFGPDERQVHELFAQQAAVAIENSENYERARERIIRQERDRLSRELHHTVSQSLFGIKLQAQNAMHHLPPEDEATRAEFSNILDIAHTASAETGFILDELRAPIAESRHLVHGLEEYTRRIKKWYNQDVSLEHNLCEPLQPWVEETLLRFAREALNNAVRHARCKTIRVRCESDEQHTLVTVCDDGVGFDESRIPPNRLGLIGMRELADEVHGELKIDTSPGQGTQVSLIIPAIGAQTS